MRSLISQVFTPRRVAALQPSVVAAVDTLLDRLAESGADGRTVDFMDRFAFQLPVTVICELLGIPTADRHQFRPLASALTAALELAGDVDGPADEAARELGKYFTPLISERRYDAAATILVSALVAARDADDGRLSDEELLANLILLLVAGFETTTDLLGNGLAILLDRPDLAAALRSGRITTAAFIEEVLAVRVSGAGDDPGGTRRRPRCRGRPRPGRQRPDSVARGSQPRPGPVSAHPIASIRTRADNKPLSFGAGHAHLHRQQPRPARSLRSASPASSTAFPASSADPDQQPVRRDRLVLRGYQTLPVRVRA